MRCQNCNKEIPKDTILCPYCSYNVTDYDKRESVLSIIKKKAGSNNTTGRKPVASRIKIIISTIIIVVIAQFFAFLSIKRNSKNFTEYDGYLVDYDIRDGRYTGVYEYEKNSKILRVTYTTYYEEKEEVPEKIIISERNHGDEISLNAMLSLMFLPFIVVAVIAFVAKL